MSKINYRGRYKDKDDRMYVAITDARMSDGKMVYIICQFDVKNVYDAIALTEEEFMMLEPVN